MLATSNSAEHYECTRLAFLLKKCTSAGDLATGVRLHSLIAASKLHSSNRYLSNLLIVMYGKCGSLENAVAVFKTIGRPNVFSWTVIITAYAQNGRLVEARQLFDSMPYKDVVVWNVMLKLYAQNGFVDEAQEVFDLMPQRDVVSWTALVSGYARNGDIDKACTVFDRMPRKNLVSWNIMISIFSRYRDLERCQKVFDEMPERDIVSWNALISAYAHNFQVEKAKALFDSMPLKKDIASWNVMLAAYGEQDMAEPAVRLLVSMDLEGSVQADRMTFLAVLEAAGSKKLLVMVIHDEIRGNGILSDVLLCAALISAYGKCGSIDQAEHLFDKAVQKNAVTWTAMISAYTLAGLTRKAVRLFSTMDLEGVPADSVAILAVLGAYGKLGDLAACSVIHAIVTDKATGRGISVDNELVSMYAKCGNMEAARSVFDCMTRRDIVTWNAAIAGYAKNGLAHQALELFRILELESFYQPNEETFSALLLACSHGGLSEDGFQFFASMKRDYGIIPTREHCMSMVDLLGRMGLLEHAEELLLSSSGCERDGWIALISSCKLHRDVKRAAKTAGLHENPDAAAYVLIQSTLAQTIV